MVRTGEFVVINEIGIHCRPAASFVKKANSFKSNIRVENLTAQSQAVNGKSILNLLTINIQQNSRMRITAEGQDAQEAINTLGALIEAGFNESEQ